MNATANLTTQNEPAFTGQRRPVYLLKLEILTWA